MIAIAIGILGLVILGTVASLVMFVRLAVEDLRAPKTVVFTGVSVGATQPWADANMIYGQPASNIPRMVAAQSGRTHLVGEMRPGHLSQQARSYRLKRLDVVLEGMIAKRM